MNLKSTIRLLPAVSIAVLAWASSASLYVESANAIFLSHEIPEPSGGSQMSSRQSIEGVELGPYSELGAAVEGEQVTTKDPTIVTTFEGFGFDDNATENAGMVFIPPDPSGAAGTDRVIAVVNVMIEARTKAGILVFRDALRDFFAPLTPTTFTFDPKVVYDQFEDRFVVVTLERVDSGSNPDPGNISRILLAVSKTATPATATAADWNFHAINSETSIGGLDHWADFPGFEVDELIVRKEPIFHTCPK